ncbi:MAG TPA: diguanylate cyclase [Xanthomonadaceae bacterium]|nr:diguanylate cyclase [Xanthomonadaceae bacterium]
MTVSIGVAPWQPRLRDLRAWVEAADQALYRAKSEGRNRVCGPLDAAAKGSAGATA